LETKAGRSSRLACGEEKRTVGWGGEGRKKRKEERREEKNQSRCPRTDEWIKQCGTTRAAACRLLSALKS
jgi:hypothetical protein